jgi:hypothetical protein
MIVVDEAREKQDSYDGPTIRLPERVLRRRRSLSPLPDYEASEAQYRQAVAFEKKKAWHQTKMWRAALFLLLTYALLTTAIGVPIIVKVSFSLSHIGSISVNLFRDIFHTEHEEG